MCTSPEIYICLSQHVKSLSVPTVDMLTQELRLGKLGTTQIGLNIKWIHGSPRNRVVRLLSVRMMPTWGLVYFLPTLL